LREYCHKQAWEIYQEYIDTASANDLRGRNSWRQLLTDARQGKFQAVLALRLDRIARSVKHLWDILADFGNQEITFISLRESFDTSTAAGKLQLNIMAALAEFELDLIRERIQEGIARARAEGKHLGRPKGAKDKRKRKKGGYRLRWAREAKNKGK
jgi:DNA invertase Pin-like site-specific DNA recombinase